MNELEDKRPPFIIEEKPARNLASLVRNRALDELTAELIHQWHIRDQFAAVSEFGIKPIDRALFYGPPGNGKTMAAAMIAKEIGCKLFRVPCEGMISSLFGGTEQNMAKVLDWLAKQGTAVVLFDECEAIFPSRSESGADACSQSITRAMQIFWQRLDSWGSPQMFLLATNMIDRIDAALPSRMELKLEFMPPTADQALKVVEYWSEILHEYGSADWAPVFEQQIKSGVTPSSFRELWQTISREVRFHISYRGERP